MKKDELKNKKMKDNLSFGWSGVKKENNFELGNDNEKKKDSFELGNSIIKKRNDIKMNKEKVGKEGNLSFGDDNKKSKYVKIKDRGERFFIDEFGFKKKLYKVRTNTKKYQVVKGRLDRVLEKIEKAKLNLLEEKNKLREYKIKENKKIKARKEKAIKLKLDKLNKGLKNEN